MSELQWKLLHPRMSMEHLGLIPSWLHDDDPDPAWKQIDKNYGHGGGWNFSAMNGTFKVDPESQVLKCPGDPPLTPKARAKLRDETIVFYDHAIVAIFQPDGSYQIARID